MKRSLPIAMIFTLFFLIAVVTGLQNPMAIIIRDQFSKDVFTSTLGTMAIFLGYGIFGYPAGIFLERRGYKTSCIAAVGIGFVGLSIMAISCLSSESLDYIQTMTLYLSGSFLSGISVCMLNTTVTPMFNTLGGGGNDGNRLVQAGCACNSMGATIVPVLAGYIVGTGSASMVSAFGMISVTAAVFLIVFVALFFIDVPEPSICCAESDEIGKANPFAYRHFTLGLIALFAYLGVEVSIPTVTNLFLTNDGMGTLEQGIGIDAATAGSIIGIYWLLMFVGRAIGSLLAGKISPRVMLLVTSAAASVLVLTAIVLPLDVGITISAMFTAGDVRLPATIMLLMSCGLCTSVMWGSIFNLTQEGLGACSRVASGIFMTMVVGGGVFPLIQGAIVDATDYVTSFWLVLFGFIVILLYAFRGCRNEKSII